jgi:hypothetical protein
MGELKSAATRNVMEYRQIHLSDPNYGRSSELMADLICKLARPLQPQNILDFGCGKSRLVDEVAARLGATAFRYDPAIEANSILPITTADLVINTDVLEHLDEQEVDLLLSDVASISKNVFFNISTRPAAKLLPSGENAHATVKNANWWREKILEHFPTCNDIPCQADEAAFITWSMPPKTPTLQIGTKMKELLNRLFGRQRRR